MLNDMGMNEVCFACGKRVGSSPSMVITEDGAQTVYVGRECAKHILSSLDGWQPPLGGPRLFPTIESARNQK